MSRPPAGSDGRNVLEKLATVERAASLLDAAGGDMAPVAAALRVVFETSGQIDFSDAFGLKARGGVQPWRLSWIEERNRILRRLREEHFASLTPRGASQAIMTAWGRYAVTFDPAAPPPAPDTIAAQLHRLCRGERKPLSLRQLQGVLAP